MQRNFLFRHQNEKLKFLID